MTIARRPVRITLPTPTTRTDREQEDTPISHVVAYTDIVFPESAVADGTLATALEALGLELRHKTNYNWYGRWVGDYSQADAAYNRGVAPEDYGKCLFAVGIKGSKASDYEIGLVANPNGAGLVPVMDFYGSGRHLRDAVGEKAQKLGTEYARASVAYQAKLSGYSLAEETLANGKIRLVATKYGV